MACDHAHSFTHQKGLSYQIFELEDSGLPQQGILPISAKKTTTKAKHRVWKKTLLTVKRLNFRLLIKFRPRFCMIMDTSQPIGAYSFLPAAKRQVKGKCRSKEKKGLMGTFGFLVIVTWGFW